MDYRKYRAGFVEKLACAAVGAGAAGMAAWLFYRSVWGMLLFPAAYLVCVKKYCALQKEKRKEQLLMEFKDAMQSASAALLAGYSVENAWRETEKELLELHGEKGFMAAEVRWMNEGVRMNEPLERLLLSFAARSGCEEIESFAEVFAFAKRSGGDFVHIMQTTVQKLAGRIEVEREVATVLAGKRLEGRINAACNSGISSGGIGRISGRFVWQRIRSGCHEHRFLLLSCRHQMVRAYIGYSDLTKGLWIKRGKM